MAFPPIRSVCQPIVLNILFVLLVNTQYGILMIDHLIITAPTREEGMDYIEERLGIRPVITGQHPQWGTHNALLSLGGEIFLEVIAPDRSLPIPERGRLFSDCYEQPPRLATWVQRAEQIEEVRHRALASGLHLGAIQTGHRTRPDGTQLSWRLTDPYAFPLQGALPFLIAWGDTPHPAHSLPHVGDLQELHIMHPEPDRVRHYLDVLDIDLPVTEGLNCRLQATIRTTDGEEVVLE